MCLYIWYVYRLAGGTATDMLVHFPAVSTTSNLSSLSSGTLKRRASVSQIIPKNTSRAVGSGTHLAIDMK